MNTVPSKREHFPWSLEMYLIRLWYTVYSILIQHIIWQWLTWAFTEITPVYGEVSNYSALSLNACLYLNLLCKSVGATIKNSASQQDLPNITVLLSSWGWRSVSASSSNKSKPKWSTVSAPNTRRRHWGPDRHCSIPRARAASNKGRAQITQRTEGLHVVRAALSTPDNWS